MAYSMYNVSENPYPLLNPPVIAPATVSQLLSANSLNPKPPVYPYGPNSTAYRTEKSKGWLFRIAVFSTIAFVVLSQSVAYKVINSVYGMVYGNYDYIMSQEGCPTPIGIVTQATIFFAFMLVILF